MDNTPTWETVVKLYMEVLEDPSRSEESKSAARGEITRLAHSMDNINAQN